jgi:hypothetical protein
VARFTNCTAMFLENSVESRSDAAPSPRPRNPNRGSANWIEDGVNTSEDIETEIWRHALDLAEPGGLGRLVEADAVVQALILPPGGSPSTPTCRPHCSAATSSRPPGG